MATNAAIGSLEELPVRTEDLIVTLSAWNSTSSLTTFQKPKVAAF